eukprot:619583-Pleurochrysis_carterae.AAC.2
MLTWCFDREACIAMALAGDEGASESLEITLHTYKPELRPYTLRFAIYAGDDFIGRSSVYEITSMRVDVPSTTDIDHKSDAFAAAAARVPAGSASLATR